MADGAHETAPLLSTRTVESPATRTEGRRRRRAPPRRRAAIAVVLATAALGALLVTSNDATKRASATRLDAETTTTTDSSSSAFRERVAAAFEFLTTASNTATDIVCPNTTFAFCDYAGCVLGDGAVPAAENAPRMAWCACEVTQGAGGFEMLVDNSYLLWSEAYLSVVEIAMAAGVASSEARGAFCSMLPRAPWDNAVTPEVHGATLLSLARRAGDVLASPSSSSLAGITTPPDEPLLEEEEEQEIGTTGCVIPITQCMGAICVPHGEEAMCACPVKGWLDASTLAASVGPVPQLHTIIDTACRAPEAATDPPTCAYHVSGISTARVPSFARFQALREELLTFVLPEVVVDRDAVFDASLGQCAIPDVNGPNYTAAALREGFS